jgi:hypothetical protein
MYVFISILLLKISANWQDSILQLIVEVLSVLIFLAVILLMSGKINRFNQTAMTMFGTDALISFMALPLFSAIAAGDARDITYILVLILMFWHWLVSGHIFRHALDKNLMTGLGIAFLYIYGSFHLMTGLFN